MAAVGAWPVPWAPYCRRGGVAGPLGPAWLPWGHGRSPGTRMAAVGRDRYPEARMATVGAWPVHWAPFGCRWSVAGPLGLV